MKDNTKVPWDSVSSNKKAVYATAAHCDKNYQKKDDGLPCSFEPVGFEE